MEQVKDKPQQVQPKSVLGMFFSLGDKVTGGDPMRKLDYDYYMLWVIFLAFGIVFMGNVYSFYKTLNYSMIGWALFGLAIMWFQYFNLKNVWSIRKYQKDLQKNVKIEEDKGDDDIESPKDMMKLFKGK